MQVFVYYNLHKKMWSVKALDGENKGRVVTHRQELVLLNPKAKVSEAGRQRVIAEKRKNVHAGLVGMLTNLNIVQLDGEQITYNPYKFNTFVYADDHQTFTGASIALMSNRQVFVI